MNHPSHFSISKFSPLAKRFILYIILFSATITLISTVLQLYSEYQRDLKSMEQQFNQVENVLLSSFSQSLWATNYQELHIQMEGLVKLPHIIYASVHNKNELISEVGKVDSENIIQRQYDLNYIFLGKENNIGTLTIVSTLDDIYAELIRDALTIFISNSIRTILVVLFIYFIFYRLISRHLSKISIYFKNIALDNKTTLVLNRDKSGFYFDELDRLVTSANEMQQRLNRAHKDFIQSKNRYHSLETVAPIGIFYTDLHGHCLFVNDKWSEITGMSADEAEGDGWVKGLHPDEREKIFKQWDISADKGIAFKLEYRFIHRDKVIWVLGQAIVEKSENGEKIGYVGSITDITELKNAQQAIQKNAQNLEKITARVPGMVYQLELHADGSMSFPYISNAINDVYHLTVKEVQDDVSKIFALTHPDDEEKLHFSISESAENLSPWKLEYRICDKDGSIRWLFGNSIPEKTIDGGILWYGFVTDITKRKETEEMLRQAQKMDALGKLTGGIAHDYNNMLGVVLGYAELLNNRLTGLPDLQKYVEHILHAAERGAKLTQKLLAFSKHKTADIKKLNINTLLLAEQHIIEKTLTVRIKLTIKLEHDLWFVCLDESELEDVLLNMSINAMHAMQAMQANGELLIETKNKQLNKLDADSLGLKPGNYVYLSFKDNGCGISDAIKEKIFDPFFTTKGIKGTGLGLSQVYGLVSRSGGIIKVASTLNQGSQFTMYFPRYEEDKNENDQVIDLVDKKIQTKAKETILVVDDEPALLNLSCEILKQQGYQVFSAERAKDAIDIMDKEMIDVLFSDIIMPEMNGYQLASLVKEKYPNIKIQLSSGFSDNGSNADDIDEFLAKNMLQKPYNAQTLLKKIRDLLS